MPRKEEFKVFYALSLAWQLGFLIAVPIGGFLLLGHLADRIFKSQPLFLIIGAAVGLTITIYEVYHLLLLLIKEKND